MTKMQKSPGAADRPGLEPPCGPLAQWHHRLAVRTQAQGFYDITSDLRAWLDAIEAGDGLLTLFVAHTSASLLIQGNDDPALCQDLLQRLNTLAPENPAYAHNNEGPEDVPSHIKSMLTAVQLTIPVSKGAMALGRFQGVFLLEHRSRPHNRSVVLHFLGTRQEAPSAQTVPGA